MFWKLFTKKRGRKRKIKGGVYNTRGRTIQIENKYRGVTSPNLPPSNTKEQKKTKKQEQKKKTKKQEKQEQKEQEIENQKQINKQNVINFFNKNFGIEEVHLPQKPVLQ